MKSANKIQDKDGNDHVIVVNTDSGQKIHIAAVASPPSSPTNGDLWVQLA